MSGYRMGDIVQYKGGNLDLEQGGFSINSSYEIMYHNGVYYVVASSGHMPTYLTNFDGSRTLAASYFNHHSDNLPHNNFSNNPWMGDPTWGDPSESSHKTKCPPHTYVAYHGFRENYEFCTICDTKRSLT